MRFGVKSGAIVGLALLGGCGVMQLFTGSQSTDVVLSKITGQKILANDPAVLISGAAQGSIGAAREYRADVQVCTGQLKQLVPSGVIIPDMQQIEAGVNLLCNQMGFTDLDGQLIVSKTITVGNLVPSPVATPTVAPSVVPSATPTATPVPSVVASPSK